MSIQASLSSDGLEEVFTAPTLKELCLYKCLKNKEILTKEVEVDGDMDESENLDWEKFRLKEPIQRDLVQALLDAGEKHLFMLTPNYEPVLAAIRMSQPEHLVKVNVSNTLTLRDSQLEFLLSGGNVKSLDIHGCLSLTHSSLRYINEFGSKLEYLRIGDSYKVLPDPLFGSPTSAILRTPNLKTFVVFEIRRGHTHYWKFLLHDFISNIEELGFGMCGWFETLEFLEPARNTLSSLTFSDCSFERDVNAWTFLFKLHNLRSLQLMGSSIEEALVGENVVQRLLTAMSNLTRLAVDPALLKDMSVDTSIGGQGSVAKRLEFLGIMDNDSTELRKAKLLAKDVAYFGTVEGELRALEYFSSQLTVTLNSGFGYLGSTFERLLKSLSEVAGTPPCNTVTVINLLLKTFKSSSAPSINHEASGILKKMLTPDVAAKLGHVLLDQCIEAFFCFMKKWLSRDRDNLEAERELICHIIDIMMNLDGELCLHHYRSLVPLAMRLAKKASMWSCVFDRDDDLGMEENLYKKIEQLLAKIVERFLGENNELWGISSVLGVIRNFKKKIVSCHEDDTTRRQKLMEILSSMIASLRKLCLNSGPRRAAFHSAKGTGIVMDLLKEIIDGRLGLADGDTFALLEIMKSILQDSNLELSDSGMIASGLEKLLISIHSQWELWKSSSSNSDGDNTNYLKMQNISSLLNYLESDSRFDYKASGAAKEIMMKLK